MDEPRAATSARVTAVRVDDGLETATDREATMQAIVQDAYGSADVLQQRDVARPRIGDREVLVRVHAAGVDRGAWHLMTGLPYLMRVIGFGLRAPSTPSGAGSWPGWSRRSAGT
jgi:hypothetical protein